MNSKRSSHAVWIPGIAFFLCVPSVLWSSGRQPGPVEKPYVIESLDAFSFRSVEDDHGGFYLIWPHAHEEQVMLVIQHVDAQGALLLQSPGFPVLNTGWQVGKTSGSWEAVSDGHGGVLLSWEARGRISAQRFSPEHKFLWTVQQAAVTRSADGQKWPALAADGAGGAYIVWQEKRFSDRWVLMAQHIDAGGSRLWSSEGIRVSLRPTNQRRPSVVFDGSAGAVIAWHDFRENASQLQVQRLNFQGSRVWGLEGVLVTAPAGDPQKPPYIAATGGGSMIVAWQASSSASNRVFLQLVNAAGKLSWQAQGLEISVGTGHQWNPVVHGDGQGGVWAGWEDYRNQSYWQLFNQHFHADGKPGWVNGEVLLTSVRADQGRLAMTDDGAGNVLSVWVDNRLGASGIYFQQVSEAGKLLFGRDGLFVAGPFADPQTPQILSLAPGKSVISWADRRSKGTWALYWKYLAPTPAPAYRQAGLPNPPSLLRAHFPDQLPERQS